MKKTAKYLIDAAMTGDRLDRMGNDMVIIENPKTEGPVEFPVQSAMTVSVIAVSGTMECTVDMTGHKTDVPGMLVILPYQTVEKISFSSGFRGYCLIMSPALMGNLPMANRIPLLTTIRRHGFYPLDDLSISAIKDYIRMVQNALRTPNGYQHEIIIHLTAAYYYGLGTYIHNTGSSNESRYGQISNDFFCLVSKNCHIHRDMDFYADALCLTSKHISHAVKAATGESATKWIERYTILKAKSMLKTTGLSVSEISEELNFPSPSDFGKYFRKFTGYSPRDFRNRH